MKKILFAILFFSLYIYATAQNKVLQYDFATDIPFVLPNNQALPLALAGGLNSPQFSTIDLNGDAKNDLFVFDRTSNRIFTFLQQNNSYVYAPAYEILFPPMQNWCLLIDYDKDGKKDIFTTYNSTVAVYKNNSARNQTVSFVQIPKSLNTKSISGNATINISIDATDIPAITDIDNDGDIDILFFTPSLGTNVEYAKNISVEKYKKLDSLEFEKVSTKWGDFQECSRCNDYTFGNNNCSEAQKDELKDELINKKAKNLPQTLRTEHSGSTQLVLDLDGNGLKDMLIGDVSCRNLAAFFNKGTVQDAKFDAFMPNFPANNPVDFYVFPASYYEDVDFDGINDLVVAPNLFDNADKLTDFRKNTWLYKNTGSNTKPNFVFQSKEFLQNQMIDIGENCRPTIVDVNADGKLDLLLANSGSLQADNSYKAQVFYYQNIGTNEQASFKLQDENIYNFLALNNLHIKISFADLNKDNALDLIFSSSTPQNIAKIEYVLNENLPNQSLNFDLTKRQILPITTSLRPFDEPLLIDINADGQIDLLLARLAGNLEYWENTGNLTFVLRTASAGGIVANPNKIALSLAVADLTNDQKLELITGDGSGNLHVYQNFMDILADNATINTNFLEISNIIRDKIYNLQVNYDFGTLTCPAVLGKNIFVGTNTGGIHFLRFTNVITGITDENSKESTKNLQIFPNPTKNSIYFISKEKLSLKLYTVLGQFTGFANTLEPNQPENWNLEQLPKGMYVVETWNRVGERQIFKIMLE
jgi:hypothetical protein